MKNVPVFYIRKAWYGILRHVYELVSSNVSELDSLEISDFDILIDKNRVQSIIHEEEAFLYTEAYRLEEVVTFRRGSVGRGVYNIHRYCLEVADNLDNEELRRLKREAFKGRKPSGAKDEGRILIESSLQENIYSPLSKPGDQCLKEISVHQALFFLKLWGALRKQDEQNQGEAEYFIEKLKERDGKDHKQVLQEKDERVFSPLRFPRKFLGVFFSSYERTDAPKGSNASWGIGIGSIYIGDVVLEDGSVEMNLQTMYSKEFRESVGFIRYDPSTEYLLGLVKRKPNQDGGHPELTSFFMMRVDDVQNQSLLVGHYSYHSSRFKGYITKSVIWILNTVRREPVDLLEIDQDFTDIDISIRRFLSNRGKNRLTIPKSPINTLQSLEFWLNERKRIGKVMDDMRLHGCVGEYFICYYNGDLADPIPYEQFLYYIRVDELTISYNENTVKFSCVYAHNLRSNLSTRPKRVDVYKGHPSRRNDTVQIHVANYSTVDPPSNSIPEEENHVLISFCLTDFDLDLEEPFSKAPYFKGTIAGLADIKSTPLCFKMLVVKKRFDTSGNLINPINFGGNELNAPSRLVYEYLFENRHSSRISFKESDVDPQDAQ